MRTEIGVALATGLSFLFSGREPEPSGSSLLAFNQSGFSRGPFVYDSGMRFAPQETRTYFVTAVTAQRRRLFQVTATAELLEHTILDYQSQGKFLLHAFVIMPDHFHALITPAPDVSLEKALQFIKGGFSFRLKSKFDVWMRSFNESQIMSEEKFIKLRAIHRGEPGTARACKVAE